MRVIKILAIFLCVPALAQQNVGLGAVKAAKIAGIRTYHSIEEKIVRAMALINSQAYVHQKEKRSRKGNQRPPPPQGTHPYEWDSLRTAEQMLMNRDGGSCGTHGLSIAAILRAAEVPSSDIRILSAVNAQDYVDICAGEAKQKRQDTWTFPGHDGDTTDIHPANGHVFLAVRINGRWKLINSTHDPLAFPLSKRSAAYIDFAARLGKCSPRAQVCIRRARKRAASLLVLEDFEHTPLSSVEMDLTGKGPPIFIDTSKFPSLTSQLGSEKASRLLLFHQSNFEQYPLHTIQDRLNLVASGSMDSELCRWSAVQVRRLTLDGLSPEEKKGTHL